MVEVGKIAFSPKEVLGRGSEGTFVYRSVPVSLVACDSCSEMLLFDFLMGCMTCQDDWYMYCVMVEISTNLSFKEVL